jgi:hypothetical protein
MNLFILYGCGSYALKKSICERIINSMELKDFISPLLVFVMVIVGILGNKKWDKEKEGIKKLTPSGWVTLIAGIITLGIAFYAAHQSNEQKRLLAKKNEELEKEIGSYKEGLSDELILAINQLIEPYQGLYVKFDQSYIKSKNLLGTPIAGEKNQYNALIKAIPIDSLKSKRFVTFLGKFAIKNQSGKLAEINQLGKVEKWKQLSFDEYIYINLREGHHKLDSILIRNTCQLGVREITTIKQLVIDDFLKAQIKRFTPTTAALPVNGRIQTILPSHSESAFERIVTNGYLPYLDKIESIRQLMVINADSTR